MKMNCWLIFGAMLSTSLLAQTVTNAPPAAPITSTPAAEAAGAKTNAPPARKKPAEKKAPAKKKDPAAELATVPLVAGPAVVAANHVNVRGQAKLKSEIVARLDKGQQVTVLEEIIRNNSAADEPSAWAKILLPTNAHVWVNSSYIDSANHTVKPKRLNLRSGPGENYSVIGRLEQGNPVKELGTKMDWTEIEAPTNAFAFIAAQYLKQETPTAVAATTETPATPTPTTPVVPVPPPTPATVTEAPAVATTPTEVPSTTPTTTPPVETPGVTNPATEMPATPAVEEPPPKRIVQREGLVRGLVSIQAPTKFILISPENGHTIDYLYTSSPNLDLRRYKGLRIIVTGEESLDDRWGNTPVITIQKIQVLDEFSPIDTSPHS